MPNVASTASAVEKASIGGLEKLLQDPKALSEAGKATQQAQQAVRNAANSVENKAEQAATGAMQQAVATGSTVAATSVMPAMVGGLDGVALAANNTQRMMQTGIPVSAVLAATGVGASLNPMLLNATTLIPVQAVGGVAAGAVDFTGKIASAPFKAVGSWTHCAPLQEIGQGITHGVGTATNPVYRAMDIISAPVNYARRATLADMAHTGSAAVDHAYEQAIRLNYKDNLDWQEALKNGQSYDLPTGDARNNIVSTANALRKWEEGAVEKLHSASTQVLGKGATGAIGDYLKEETAYGAALKVGAVASIAKQDIATFEKFASAFDKLKALYADIQGVDVQDVKAKDVIFAKDLPPCFNTARSNIFSNIPAAAAMTVVSNLVAWETACRMGSQHSQQGMMAAMFVQGGIALAAGLGLNMVTPKSEFLDAHAQISAIYNTEGELPKAAIALMIEKSSPSFQVKGQEMMLAMLADHYYEKALSPAQLLNEITSGKVEATGYLLCEALNEQMIAKEQALSHVKDVALQGKLKEKAPMYEMVGGAA